MSRVVALLVIAIACSKVVQAQTLVYSPLSTWQKPYSAWETRRVALESASGPKSSPTVLPGVRPRPVELLQEALLRKHPQLLQNDARLAREVILDLYLGKGTKQSRINGRNILNGAMAEALFLEKNPDWKYVSKRNASQHDVYRVVVGRPPMNGQVKYHASGRPEVYARDMVKDYRAHRFLIPDDHVPPVRDYWLQKRKAALARGDVAGAKLAARNAGRVQPLGATSHEIAAATKQAAESVAAERNATYISLAFGIALSLGQISWDYAQGSITPDQAAYRAIKAMSLMGTGIATDSLLFNNTLRGTLRGNLIVGGVVLFVETSWNIYEHGGLAAFRHPEFYEQLAGSVSAVSIGGVAAFYSGVAATMAATELGPLAPIVGSATAVVVGSVVGAVAYVGGRSTTSWLIHSIWPELYQECFRQQIWAARERINQNIRLAQQFP